MLTVTFIRHGQSIDNLRHAWAGWADAALSQRGKAQAEALGAYFSQTIFTKIYASPLKRAATTAALVLAAQRATQLPPHTFNVDLIKEQNFGVAEGKPWCSRDPGSSKSLAEYVSEGKYPFLLPGERFAGGESDQDLAARAVRAVDEVIMPHVWSAASAGCTEHIALVSHGLCIGALISALLMRDCRGVPSTHGYSGMKNTAWARVVITLQGAVDGTPLNLANKQIGPQLFVKVTDIGRADHLVTLKPDAGGTGKIAYDPKQGDIRTFFSGEKTAVATERCEGDALDEIDGK